MDESIAAAEAIGYPVVLKADAPGLTHKTDAGGVVLDVRDAAGVRAAWDGLRVRTNATRVVVQERIAPGVELLVGANRDDAFGPVVVLGTGGVFTEVVQDVSIRLAPVTDDDVDEMLDEGARPRLLAGPRGMPPVDRGALAALVTRVSDLIASESRIREIDINPLLSVGTELIAVDALVILADAPEDGSQLPSE